MSFDPALRFPLRDAATGIKIWTRLRQIRALLFDSMEPTSCAFDEYPPVERIVVRSFSPDHCVPLVLLWRSSNGPEDAL